MSSILLQDKLLYLFLMFYVLLLSVLSVVTVFRQKIFETDMAKPRQKIKHSKIYFQHLLDPLVLHIRSKFHVSSLIFEGDLFSLILRKMPFC